ncbi:MAG: ribonuclease HI [Alphaproteobacteria bacterium]|nr:ribonuclease HI [Alphaproteobacteria bacterium]
MKHVDIFTDGACSGNPGKGGWAALLRYGAKEKTLSGAEAQTTNNRMEMTALIEALSSLKEKCSLTLHTDSQYLMNGSTKWLPSWKAKGWKTAAKKDVLNVDLWKKLDMLLQKHQIEEWIWVKGHNGHLENETVDTLAREAILTLK